MINLLKISIICLFSTLLTAQYENRLKPAPQPEAAVQAVKTTKVANVNQPLQSTTIWSEDFSNGIPADWVNQGYSDGAGGLTPNPNCNWEFRGPNTTPGNAMGSRGVFSDGRTIASKTPGDFLIFDSGYLDNGGMQPLGSGSCPSPHVGTLTTDTIDLISNNEIDLFLHSMAFKFVANFEIAFSSDGGLTFPDTIQVLPNLGINSATEQDDIIRVDASPYIGGASNAMIAFIFDGGRNNNNNPNGDGYYYWQIDDIEIREKPGHRLDFNALAPGLPNKVDISADGEFEDYPKEGFTLPSQAKPMEFTASLTNTGTETQKNIRFNVDFYDGGTLSTIHFIAIN
ncbi:MAG: hypothetical protein U5L96_16515 [Owenweeksia sp.]|nr:hypothetical protein [Owenweeksia sp.]